MAVDIIETEPELAPPSDASKGYAAIAIHETIAILKLSFEQLTNPQGECG
jgi:hypothetical protein